MTVWILSSPISLAHTDIGSCLATLLGGAVYEADEELASSLESAVVEIHGHGFQPLLA